MTRGRAAIALITSAIALLQAAPASAAITSPSDGAILNADPVLRGSVDVGRSASGVTLTVSGPAGIVTAGGACGSQGVSCSGNVVSFDVPVSLDRNGAYTVKAVGYHRATSPLDSDASNAETSAFGLEIPPKAPRRLEAVADRATRSVAVSWAANHEPDLVGYQLLRSVDGGVVEARANVAPSEDERITFVDAAEAGGELSYQVVAVRRGATAERVVAGPLSGVATTSLPRPVTTTTEPGTGSAESGGGPPTGGTSGAEAASGGLRPTATATPVVIKPGSTLDLSGFTPNPPAPRPTATPAEGDPGYQELLPYKSKAEPGDDPVVGQSALPTEQVTETGSSENRKALLTFLAGAMVLFVTSMHLRWLLRRVAPVT